MLIKLEPEAQELAQYMSALSEQAYDAGWMSGLELELWDAVVNGPREYGRLSITNEHIDELRRLSDVAGGWIVFDEKHEEALMPLKNWKTRFESWKQGQSG